MTGHRLSPGLCGCEHRGECDLHTQKMDGGQFQLQALRTSAQPGIVPDCSQISAHDPRASEHSGSLTSPLRPQIPMALWSLFRIYSLRATRFWLAVHVAIALLTFGETIALRLLPALALTCLAGLVGFLDSRRNEELLFLRNLGMGPTTVVTCWMVVIMLLEIVLTITATPVLGTAP